MNISSLLLAGFVVLCALNPDDGKRVVDIVGWAARSAFTSVEGAVRGNDYQPRREPSITVNPLPPDRGP
jgi:hypothetical protein